MKARWFSVVVAVILGSFLASGAWAQNLSHNLASTLDLGTGAVSYVNVLVGSGGGSTSTIVDATGTTSFTSNGTQFYVGAANTGTSIGTLNLGILNTITANQVTIGGLEPDSNGSGGHAGTVTTLANGTTTINATNMAIGSAKGTGTFTLGSDATLNLYGLTGSGSRANLVLGRYSNDTARAGNGTMNLSGGAVNLVLSELALAKGTGRLGAVSTVSGTMTLGDSANNHLDISGAGSVVKIGYYNYVGTLSNSTTTFNGSLTIGNLNSTSSITSTDNSTAILISHEVEDDENAATVNGTLNLNGGTLTITTTGAAIAGGNRIGTTQGTSTLNLSGGMTLVAGDSSSNWIHSLTTATIGSGGATIDTNGNNVGISQAFSGAGGLIKDGEGTLTISGTQGYTGATEVKAGELSLTGSLNASSAVTVRSGATISGTGTVNGSLDFESNANLVYGAAPLNVTGIVSFASGFSVANILGFDWGTAVLDSPYTLIAGDNVDLTNLTQVNVATAGDVGGGRSAYFKEGSLQLVVIPEPATLSMIGIVGIAMLLRRRIVRG